MSFTAPTQRKRSNEEEKFIWYLDELVEAGYVESYQEEPESWVIVPDKLHKKEHHYRKQQNKIVDFTLLQGLTYTYDVRIIWTEKAEYYFYELFDYQVPFVFGKPHFIAHEVLIDGIPKIVSYVDVKPHRAAADYGGHLSSFYTFPLIQKFCLDSFGLYVNKAVPLNVGRHGVNTCLFAVTFTPNRFKFTDKGKALRKIRFTTRSLEQYVKLKTSTIENYVKIEQAKSKSNNQQSLGL